MSEHDEQVALFEWAAFWKRQHPELELLYAIPNGGHRHKAVAARMSAEGVRAGVPDVCLPVARSGYHGLYIEMKYGKNKATESQEWWLEHLTNQGYACIVCYGFDEAKKAIDTYLDGSF